ncbi:UNVERIFIED_CONTAM: putative mitochondrial protein [Sesamum latifolium]|uniref:Mitochondrial protein n=1 Tax=Sesamum latifolium TaxID=2727402 RepID=A0AAW2SRT9_9LAMI
MSSPSEEAIAKVVRGMQVRVSGEMNEALIQPFSPDEVRLAISQMYPYKSPGPDGLSPIFYQKFWHIVGPEIISFVLDFLNHGHLDQQFNYTYIVLIPKCASPENMSHFHPISLCNVTYKIASKILANRLKPILPNVISESQSAFITGRLITDNVLVAYELNHYLAHKTWGLKGHAALKLDLSKAYDRVEWIFLERVLVQLGFHSHFISLIHLCVSSVSFSFILEGQKFGYFHPQRGLHQGDPLSPYLFLFCAEALSHLISGAVSNGELHGVAVSRLGPRVSHLLFADDTLFFCQATRDAMLYVGRILKDFEATSGLMVNLEKSSVSFSRNVPGDLQADLASILGVRVVNRLEKYLELPALVGRSKKEVFQQLKDKVWARLQSWRCQNLSPAGKVVLLKSVVQAMPTFLMGCFLIPATICRELESMMADFLWHNKISRKVHWLSWEKLCADKNEGNLEFRKFSAFNRAMLAKQLWHIIMHLDSLLSRLLKQKYFPTSDVLSAVAGPGSSFTWWSMLEAREVILAGTRWHVGTGRGIRIWHDRWIPRPLSFRVITAQNTLGREATMDELVGADGEWNLELLLKVFRPDDVQAIVGISRANASPDRLRWHYEKNGKYSVKSAYRLISAGFIPGIQNGTTGSKSYKSDNWHFI